MLDEPQYPLLYKIRHVWYVWYSAKGGRRVRRDIRLAEAVIEIFVAINGSPSAESRTAAVTTAAVELNGAGRVIHLGELDASALLARAKSSDVEAALKAVRGAGALCIASPVYRRTYSGLLKAFFDLFEPGALAGKPTVLAVTAGHGGEALCIDHCMRPLVASLDGWSTPTAVYATHADFENGEPGDEVRAKIRQGLVEAEAIAH